MSQGFCLDSGAFRTEIIVNDGVMQGLGGDCDGRADLAESRPSISIYPPSPYSSRFIGERVREPTANAEMV